MLGKDQFIVNTTGSFITNHQQILAALYMPLIGIEAVGIYNLLYAERKGSLNADIERLCILSGLDIESLKKHLILLEQFSLVERYYKDGIYVFVVISPVNANDFFENDVYARLYLNKVGKKQFEITKAKYLYDEINFDSFKNLTNKKLDLSVLKNWSEAEEMLYQSLKQPIYKEDAIEIKFDYDRFIRSLGDSVLLFPYSLRTKENMQTIGQLATLFSITPEKMKTLVAKSIDIEANTFDGEKLKKLCLNEKSVDVVEGSNEYDLSPVSFLYLKQGVPVSNADKRLLEYLQIQLQMKPEVINVLIEHCLENTNQKLSRDYVEKVATTWIRQKVETLEDALKQKENRSYSRKKSVKYDKDELKFEEQDLEKLRKRLFSKG
ncbi:MAG TPA: DnaD domain protein [Erysipelotrichaceae bacterium]|nr:DnaD domain protein [Erysipelotrichaceae bacterium]